MDKNTVGSGQFEGGKAAVSSAMGNSVVVRLFMAVVRGEVEVHAPANEFVTVAVAQRGRMCLRCSNVGLWDLWHGRKGNANFCLGRCRVCGEEVAL